MMHGTIHIRSSLNIFPVIKSRRMIQTGHPGRMGGGAVEGNTGFWRENVLERDQLEDLSVNGITILKWVLMKSDGKHGLE